MHSSLPFAPNFLSTALSSEIVSSLSVCQSASLFLCLSVSRPACLPAYLSVCLSVCLMIPPILHFHFYFHFTLSLLSYVQCFLSPSPSFSLPCYFHSYTQYFYYTNISRWFTLLFFSSAIYRSFGRISLVFQCSLFSFSPPVTSALSLPPSFFLVPPSNHSTPLSQLQHSQTIL